MVHYTLHGLDCKLSLSEVSLFQAVETADSEDAVLGLNYTTLAIVSLLLDEEPKVFHWLFQILSEVQ